MTHTHYIRLQFDAEGEPPTVHLWRSQPPAEDRHLAEVDEEPVSLLGGRLVETTPGCWDWQGPWSWDPEDWEPGPLARHLVAVLDANPLAA